MSVQGDLLAALMGRVESLSGVTVVWPRLGAAQPAGQHVRAAFLPNDDSPADLGSNTMARQGFLVLTLVSDLSQHQVVSENDAGVIAEHFPRGLTLSSGSVKTKITGQTVKPSRQEGGRWETPIFISYEAWA